MTTDTNPAQIEPALHDADFADIHLRVGDPVIVQPVAVLDTDHIGVSFIGAHHGQSFITTPPDFQKKGIRVKPGSSFNFRIVHGMYVYAFTSSTLCIYSRPYPHVHFAIPESVKYRQVRQALRLETRLPVEIHRADGTLTMAIMFDLSQYGAKLELTGQLDKPGADIKLSIPIVLPDETVTITPAATIRNGSDPERSMAAGRFQYGVSFKDISSQDTRRLQHFIEHLLVEQLA